VYKEQATTQQPTKKAKATISKALRVLVWITYNGEDKFNAKCYCCENATTTPFDFECGHVVAEVHGGQTDVDNLRPICSTCNRSMHTTNLYEFKKQFCFPEKTEPLPLSTQSIQQ
jgi:5-methylcytosine-specific restriction endonuclease McrA